MKQITFLVVILTLLTAQQLFAQKCDNTKEGRAEEFYYSGSMLDEAVKQKTVFDILNQTGDMSEAMAWVIALNHYDELLIDNSVPDYKEHDVDLESTSFWRSAFGIILNKNESIDDKLDKATKIALEKSKRVVLKKNAKICMDKINGDGGYREYYNSFFSNLDYVIFFNDSINLKDIEVTGNIPGNVNKNDIRLESIEKVKEVLADSEKGKFAQIFNAKFGGSVKPFQEITRSDEQYYSRIFDEGKHPFHKKAFFAEADYYVIISIEKLNLQIKEGVWNIIDATFTFKVVNVATNKEVVSTSISSIRELQATSSDEYAYRNLIFQLIDNDINPQLSTDEFIAGQGVAYEQFFATFYKSLAIETKDGFDVDIYLQTNKISANEIDIIIKEMNNGSPYKFEEENAKLHKNGLYTVHLSQCKFDVSYFQMDLLRKFEEKINVNNSGVKLTNRAGPHHLVYLEEEKVPEKRIAVTPVTEDGYTYFKLRPQIEYLDFDFNNNIRVTMLKRGREISIKPEISLDKKVITVYPPEDVELSGTYKFKFNDRFELEHKIEAQNNNNEENNTNNNNGNSYTNIDIQITSPKNKAVTSNDPLAIVVSCKEDIKKLDLEVAKVKGHIDVVPSDANGYTKVEYVNFNEGSGIYQIDVEVTTVTGKKGKASITVYYKDSGSNDGGNNMEINDGHGSIIKSKHYMLNIGISKFADSQFNLNYAHKDATDLSQEFKKQNNLDDYFDEVVVYTLINEQATKKKIIEAMNLIKSLVKPSDFVSVTFSTHGYVLKDHYYLFPHEIDVKQIDYSGIRFDYFYKDYIKTLTCGTLVMIDACYSGEGIKDPFLFEKMTQELNDTKKVRILLMSSQADQTSREKKDWQNGAYTEAILGAFENKIYSDRNGNYIPDKNNNGFVELQELSEYVTNVVRIITNGNQTVPKPFVENLSNLNNFAIIKTN